MYFAWGGGYHLLSNNIFANAITNDDNISHVLVEELFDSKSKKFNTKHVQALFDCIEVAQNTTYDDTIKNLTGGTTSDGIPAYYSASIREKIYNKKSTQDVTVTLRDLTLQVKYPSLDSLGNTILTLWLTGYQMVWAGESVKAGTHFDFINTIETSESLKSIWSNNVSNTCFKINYPTNMYSTSYINAVTLNNCEEYISLITSSSDINAVSTLSTARQGSS